MYTTILGSLSFTFAGTANGIVEFLLAEFLLNVFASSSRSYLKRMIVHYSLKIAS
jgi:hypothetical protein